MARLRTALAIAGGGFLAVLAVLALAFGLAQTGPGKRWLAAALGHWLSDPQQRIAIAGIDGLVPFDMTIREITLRDAQGPRITISDAAIAVAPADLLAARLTLRRLAAREVKIARSSQSSGGGNVAALLNPPLAVTLERLELDRVELGPAVLGEPVALTLRASGAVGGGRAAADLDLHRIDGVAGSARLHLALGGDPLRLDLAGDVAEPSGRLLADLLGRSETLPLTLHLAGAGPLADWQGKLAASAGKDAMLAALIRIRSENGYRVTAEGTVQAAAALLGARLAPLFAGETRFSTAATLSPDTVALDALSLSAAAGSVTASGSYARDTERIAGTAHLDLPDLAGFSPLLAADMEGGLEASLTLDGTRTAPRAHVMIEGDGLGIDGNRAAQAKAGIDLAASGDPVAPATPITVTASGGVSGLALAAAKLPAGLGDHLDWHAALRVEREAERVALTELAVADAGTTLTAQGSLVDSSISGKAHLTVPEIAAATAGALQGALALDADFRAGTDGAGTVALSGTLHPPAGGTSMLDALIGSEAHLAATLQRRDDGVLSAREVELSGANFRVTAGASRAADGAVAGKFSAELPRLAALDPRLAGGARLNGDLGGRADAIAVAASLEGDAIAAGPVHLQRLAAKLSIPDLAKETGRIAADFAARGLAGTVSADATLSSDAVRLTRLRLDAGGTRLEGALAYGFAHASIDGTLSANAPDLKPWAALFGMPLAGSVQAKATLAAKKGQSVDLALDGKGLAWGSASSATLQRLHVATRLSDVRGNPQGRAELTAEDAKLGAVAVKLLHLDASSDRPGHFAITAEASGDAGENFALKGSAAAAIAAEQVELRVTRLDGEAAGQPVHLDRPLQISRRNARLAFTDLALGLGSGKVAGAGSLTGESLSLHLRAENLPVSVLAAFGGAKDVGGVLGFEVTLGGTRRRPQGDVVLDAEELRFAAATHPDLPPLSLVASATWRGDQVEFKGRLAGPQNTALGFAGKAPLVLDASLAPRLPPNGALALRLEGNGELAGIADLLPLGEDRLAGRFTIDVGVAGTVASPVASGRLQLRNGRYESLVSGTVLSGVNFDLVGNRDRLVLQSFTAGDGGRGTLALAGAVNLAAAAGPSLDVSGQLKSFQVVGRDEATARASGELRLSGSVAHPRLAGRLRIESAVLRVPENLPQQMQPIDVITINSATGEILSTPAQQKTQTRLALTLDVAVDMPGQILVSGRGLNSEWRGNLTVTGTSAAPRLAGRLEVVRGTYDFLGKSARLTRGTITFVGGGQRIDPDIDIEAQASSADVVAIVHIIGTALQPKITLSSQPDMPQDEILSRLLFGASISQVSAAQGLEIAQAAAALASGGGPGVLDRIRQGLGLDRLTIGSDTNSAFSTFTAPSLATTPGIPGSPPSAGVGTSSVPLGAANSGTSAAGAAAVSAGKYVANGVYVGVTQGITAGSSSVDVQVDATRHVTIDTTAGQATGAGVGINWKLDY